MENKTKFCLHCQRSVWSFSKKCTNDKCKNLMPDTTEEITYEEHRKIYKKQIDQARSKNL